MSIIGELIGGAVQVAVELVLDRFFDRREKTEQNEAPEEQAL